MQDDNGKAPPIIGSNRLTVLKPEMSSSPFKYDPLFQSGGENSVFENINNSQPRTDMKKQTPFLPVPAPTPPPPFLKAVYLAPRQRSHQGRALESPGPPSPSLLSPPPSSLPLPPLGFRAILKKTLRPPLSSSLETKQIEFRSFDWLQRADLATSPSVARARSWDFRGSPGAPVSASK